MSHRARIVSFARLSEALAVARAGFLSVWLRKPEPSPDHDPEWCAAETTCLLLGDECRGDWTLYDAAEAPRAALADALFGFGWLE